MPAFNDEELELLHYLVSRHAIKLSLRLLVKAKPGRKRDRRRQAMDRARETRLLRVLATTRSIRVKLLQQ